MAEFKEILRFEKVDESGNVLQAEDIDLRRGIVGEEAPTENTPGMAGLLYYVVRDGKITAEYVCVAAEEGVYTWKKKKSGAVDDTLTVPGAAADAAIVGKKLTEQSSAISDKITAPSTVTVGQTIVVSEVDENGKPTKWEAIDMASGGTSDAVQYVPQELTDEQQMQARENLGLYRKKKEPILVTKVGPDAPGHLLDITNDMSSLRNPYEDVFTIEIWDASPEQLREKFCFEHQGRRYNSGSGGDIYLYWYGNLDLIIQNDTAAAKVANEIGHTSEGQYTDVPFVLYTYVDEDNRVNKKWCLFIDSSLTPLHWIGFAVKIFLDKTQTVYYPVPQEYIPVLDEIVLNSSYGSGKQFRVTVDDTGVLSATEITE